MQLKSTGLEKVATRIVIASWAHGYMFLYAYMLEHACTYTTTFSLVIMQMNYGKIWIHVLGGRPPYIQSFFSYIHGVLYAVLPFNKIFHCCCCCVVFFFQDTQLLLWDLVMDEIVVPLRRCPPGGSPTFSSGSQSSHWDNICPVGTLQPAPSMRDVPKLSPVVVHRVHAEPLSGLIFTNESIVTVCREGHAKIWMRPGHGDSQTSNSETVLSTSLKDKPLMSGKVGISSYKQ